jgi:hypothetical protein
MISKKELKENYYYNGKCRNSTVAMWMGDEFIFINFHFGKPYIETIQHISDSVDGYDGFIPISIIEPEYEQIRKEKNNLHQR